MGRDAPSNALRARVRRNATRVLVMCATLLTLAGCSGDGVSFAGADISDHQTRLLGPRVTVIVTTDGGRRMLARRSVRIERGDTAVSVLQQVADVRIAPNGAIAQVNGEGGGAMRTFGPEQAAWTYRVDGIETLGTRPERFYVDPGQSVWWDLRRTDIYPRIPVAVGTFPQPFFHGWTGADDPVRITYGSDLKEDAEYLRDAIFRPLDPSIVDMQGSSNIGGIGDENDRSAKDLDMTLAVRPGYVNIVIARWEELRMDPYIIDIQTDTKGFGLTLWIEQMQVRRQDPDMEFSEPLPEAEGLVWASTVDGEPDGTLVLAITGITDDGVRAAQRALVTGECQYHIACAVDRNGIVIR